MQNLIKFNEMFPDSSYREIHSYYDGEDDEKYGSNKSPINSRIVMFDEIKNTTNRIGWIVPDEYVVVDVDNLHDSSIIFKLLTSLKIKFSLFRTKRGGHFIFKNNRTIPFGAGKITAIGYHIDTRCHNKGYIVLPHNDPDRQWFNIEKDMDYIPFFLLPLKNLKGKIDFTEIGKGSRNDILHKHFLNLIDYADELTIDEKIETILIINRLLFKNPLPDEELKKTVLREELIEKKEKESIEKKKKITENEMADILLSKFRMITVNGRIYVYDGKYYKAVSDDHINYLIHIHIDNDLKKASRNEVLEFIKLKTVKEPDEIDTKWYEINVRNGILNIQTMKLRPHTPDEYNTIYVNRNFVENAPYSERVDSFLNYISSVDADKKQLLKEIVGYTLIKRNMFEKFFICVGEGKTGKSTYLSLIRNIVGEENASELTLQDLDEAFMPINLFRKLVNIGDDIGTKRLSQTNFLKKLSSGQKIMAREIYKAPFNFVNFATLIYSTNQLPAMDDKTTGLWRRLVIIEINRVITDADPFWMDKMTEKDYEYLMWIGVKAINEALKRGHLTEPDSVVEMLNEYINESTSTRLFLTDNGITREQLVNEKKAVRELYSEYSAYCEEGDYRPFNSLNFRKEVQQIFGITTKNTTSPNDRTQKIRYVEKGR